jgi:uncharacterized membrane protein YphA (DoxX/SURF4 family)
MLNPFPELLNFQFVIITFLRIVLAFIFLWYGYQRIYQNPKTSAEFFRIAKFPFPVYWSYFIGGVEFLAGLCFLFGAFVQYSANALSLITFGLLILKDRKHPYLKNDFIFYVLLFVLSFSMIFFGAGAIAFDIPL